MSAKGMMSYRRDPMNTAGRARVDDMSDNADRPLDPESTQVLLARVRSGDADALNRLVERSLPKLRRWAHGRLAPALRDINDTNDLVQDAIISALRHLDSFQPRHEGALQAYLRQIVRNRIMDLARSRRRRPDWVEVPASLPDNGTLPEEKMIKSVEWELYDTALERLRPEDREAIILRLELQYEYEELKVALDKPTADAARVAVIRAMKRLGEEIALLQRQPGLPKGA